MGDRARVLSIAVAALASVVALAADEIELELSPPRPVSTGFWQYRVMRSSELTNCGMLDERPTYSWHTIHVENVSNDTLSCTVQLTCGGRICFPTTTTSATSLILPKAQVMVIRACMQPNDPYDIKADCLARGARTPLKVPANCKYEPVTELNASYPVAARRLREQGPVDLAFTLREAEGLPSDAAVVGSSLSARIDEAALKALRGLRLRTTCPGTRFEMQLNFQLDAEGNGTVLLKR